MALYFLDDVFRLHFALEPAQCILKGFAFLDTNFCQINTPPDLPMWLVIDDLVKNRLARQ